MFSRTRSIKTSTFNGCNFDGHSCPRDLHCSHVVARWGDLLDQFSSISIFEYSAASSGEILDCTTLLFIPPFLKMLTNFQKLAGKKTIFLMQTLKKKKPNSLASYKDNGAMWKIFTEWLLLSLSVILSHYLAHSQPSISQLIIAPHVVCNRQGINLNKSC